MQTDIETLSGADFESKLPASASIRIIWFIGIACIGAGFLFFLSSYSSGRFAGHEILVNQNSGQEFKSIDQLLLTPDEALLTDKKSFVNGALRFQWRNQEPDLNQGKNRSILYDNILKKKLQRIPRASVADFSIKPVPK
jgi:hypothetical protein